MTFITGTFGALARALWAMAASPSGLGTFLQPVLGGEVGFLSGLAATLWSDRAAFWMLVSGLSVGYLLSWWSDRRVRRYFSGFWHRSRPLLRTALRRTPARQWAVTSAPYEVEAVGRERRAVSA